MRVGKIFSVSYAYMFEEEQYDSVATFARHSIRPKVKLVLADGAFFMDWRSFYKPMVDDPDDFLLENVFLIETIFVLRLKSRSNLNFISRSFFWFKFKYLLARMVYTDGLITLFSFGGIYASTTFGFSFNEII